MTKMVDMEDMPRQDKHYPSFACHKNMINLWQNQMFSDYSSFFRTAFSWMIPLFLPSFRIVSASRREK